METCRHGHPWERNTYINTKGCRECVECRRLASARYDSRQRAKEAATIRKGKRVISLRAGSQGETDTG